MKKTGITISDYIMKYNIHKNIIILDNIVRSICPIEEYVSLFDCPHIVQIVRIREFDPLTNISIHE